MKPWQKWQSHSKCPICGQKEKQMKLRGGNWVRVCTKCAKIRPR